MESSAVVAWLIGESAGPQVRSILNAAQWVTTSDLTLSECERALIRAIALGRLTETEALDCRRELIVAAARWNLLRIGTEVVERARRPFPTEPIRTLDAIHLASALAARVTGPGLEILSLDDRIREAGRNLGFKLQPR